MRKTRILCLFPFQHNQQMSAEYSGRGGRGDTYSAPLDNTDVVSHALENADPEPNSVTSAREPVHVTYIERLLSPLAQENEISCMSIIRNSLESKDFLMQQPILSCLPGDYLQRLNMTHTLKDGFSSVLKGRLIQFHDL